MTAAALTTPDYWSAQRATDAQQIAADSLRVKAGQLASITSSAMTPTVRKRATELRRECETLCTQLRRSGI